jgi:tetratricopeptide (TPR) repeat protein
MTEERVCETCGNPYAGTVCPNCAELDRLPLLPSYSFIGFVFFLLLLIGLSVTRIAVSTFEAKQRSIAEEWQNRGSVDLSGGRAAAAIEDFENALVYDRENASFRMKLASALVQAGRYDEAQSHLRSLWEERPADSSVNLQLARLAARNGNLDQAERYYEGAIYGVWSDDSDPYVQREAVRLELAQALIHGNKNAKARAQLEMLSAELPASSPRRKDVGDLLMRAGAPRSAFQQYLEARGRAKGNSLALELSQAAFAQNDFALAAKWATTAVRENPDSKEAAEFARKAERVLANDPYQDGICEQKRTERIVRAFQTADTRLERCFSWYKPDPNAGNVAVSIPGVTPAIMQQVGNFRTWAEQLRPQMTTRRLRRRDDVEENAMRFVFQTQQFAAKNCSIPPTEDDSALISLAKERWSNE